MLDAAVLGARSEKDLDVFIVARERGSVATIVRDFTSRIGRLAEMLDYDIIVKHDHRGWTTGKRPVLHLMFYPSYEHAISCELPSLLTYIYDRGEYLAGDHSALSSIARCFRHDHVKTCDARTIHMHRYAEIAITSLIYLETRSHIYSNATLSDNLLYVLRFAVTQALLERISPNDRVNFWDWPDLIAYLGTVGAEEWLIRLFRDRDRQKPRDEMRRLFVTACDVTERGIEALRLPPRELAALRR